MIENKFDMIWYEWVSIPDNLLRELGHLPLLNLMKLIINLVPNSKMMLLVEIIYAP